MRFSNTPISGVLLVEPEPHTDERGLFARTYCRDELAAQGISADFIQHSVSFNHLKGTLRGMHWQAAPHEETKLVRCTMGAVYDVVVDLRLHSATFKQWYAAELTAQIRRALLIPPGLAHGFQTLADATELLYMITPEYHPDSSRGARFNDPAFAITWPLPVSVVSDRDARLVDFKE